MLILKLMLSNPAVREMIGIRVKFFILVLILVNWGIKTTESFRGGGGSGYNSACKSDADCDHTRSLRCLGDTKTCGCRNALGMIWVPEENSCMLMENHPCGRYLHEPKCVTNSSCIAGRCECNDKFLRDNFGWCKLSYGNVCSKDTDCAMRYLLKCEKPEPYDFQRLPTCKCLGEGEERVWDDLRRRCVSKAGGACDTENSNQGKDDTLECIENAECVSPGVCQCKPGWIETMDRTCLLQYGERCDASQGRSCNRYQHLNCQQGVCSCEFYGQMTYDDDIHECRILVNESCDPNRERNFDEFLNSTAPRSPKCVKDAFCKRREGSRRGTCRCLEGFEATLGRECTKEKGYGFPCSASMDCDSSRFLECVINTEGLGHCRCRQNEMFYDGKQCRVYPGSRCTLNKFCANNSYCEGDWCVCADEFQFDVDRKECLPSTQKSSPNPMTSTTESLIQFEESVTSDDSDVSFRRICNNLKVGTLEWEKCQCELQKSSHTWVSPGEYCAGLVGTRCKFDNECVPHAICDSHLQICQCSSVSHTMNDRTCSRSSASEHSIHEHQHHVRDCLEIHKAKELDDHVKNELYTSSGPIEISDRLVVLTATAIIKLFV